MAKVSVAMAVYNGETYLPVQLDSILRQLAPEDELVVSYDRSTDGSLALLERYASADARVKLFPNPGKGVTLNFDNALRHCTGDYIFISDQDDQWAPNKYARVMQAFAESGADLVIHNGVHTDNKLQPIADPFFTIYRIGDGKLKNLLKPRYSGCCMAFTKALRDVILPIPADIGAYDHWVGMVGETFGKIYYVDDILLYHRLHDGNVTPVSHRSFSTIFRARTTMVRELRRRVRRERGRAK